MNRAVPRYVGKAGYMAAGVDSGAGTDCSPESSQIVHGAVENEYVSRDISGCVGIARHLATGADAATLAVGPTESSKIVHRAIIEKCVKPNCRVSITRHLAAVVNAMAKTGASAKRS